MRFGPSQSVLWAAQLQWQTLKSLALVKVDWIHLLPKITGSFRDLKVQEISTPNPCVQSTRDSFPSAYNERLDQLYTFLEVLPPLRTFIGYDLPQETLAVLANHHADSLHHLRFRTPLSQHSHHGLNKICPEMLPFRASIESLVKLPNQFPNLKSLGLNIGWTSDERLVSPHVSPS